MKKNKRTAKYDRLPDYPIGREPSTLYEVWKAGAFPCDYYTFARKQRDGALAAQFKR